MKHAYIFLLFIALAACKNDQQEPIIDKEKKTKVTPKELTKAQNILNRVIEKAGGEKYETTAIEFRFRGKEYVSVRNCGMYELQRTQITKEGDTIKDVVSNMGFERFVNRKKENLPDSLSTKYGNSVNSVHYFVQLPFGLNDPAVKKTYLDTVNINDIKYHKIKVQFAKEGGGDDHHDVYMYWINQEDNTIDYLAYSFEVNGGGMRFRKAINPRVINSIRFADYENYAPKKKGLQVEYLDEAYINNELEKISEIRNENIQVILGKEKCD